MDDKISEKLEEIRKVKESMKGIELFQNFTAGMDEAYNNLQQEYRNLEKIKEEFNKLMEFNKQLIEKAPDLLNLIGIEQDKLNKLRDEFDEIRTSAQQIDDIKELHKVFNKLAEITQREFDFLENVSGLFKSIPSDLMKK